MHQILKVVQRNFVAIEICIFSVYLGISLMSYASFFSEWWMFEKTFLFVTERPSHLITKPMTQNAQGVGIWGI